MIKAGITAPMGSGKSYCCKIFEKLGVPVFYADDVARLLNNNNESLKNKIRKEFGDSVYDESGIMIPSVIRSIIFVEGGEKRLLKFKSICHPYVFVEYEKFCKENSKNRYTIAETAILFESKMRIHVDMVIFVSVEEKLRIERTFKRSGFSKSEYKQRMKNQIDSEIKKKLSDFIIYNNENDDVYSQILKIHNQF